MQDHHSNSSEPTPEPAARHWTRSWPFGLAAAIAAVLLAAGSGTAWWAWNFAKSWTTPVSTTSPIVPPSGSAPSGVPTAPAPVPAPADTGLTQSPVPSPTASVQAAEQTVQAYRLKDEGGQLKLVGTPVSVSANDQPEQKLRSALEALLSTPTAGDTASTIPAGTAVRSVSIEPDGVHVDLSAEFKSGGGSTSMSGRLGQIVYTATTIDPTAKVWISVQGEPLQVLGGEGIEVDQPMTRQSFDENFAL